MTHAEFPWLNPEEYPFQPHILDVDGHRLHYLDEGAGNDDVLVFVHGTPSWSFDFRHLILGLRHRYRCIAPDHMGFGLSGKPQRYNYATRHHAATFESLVTHLQLRNITLVVHDFGGPIGLPYALKHPGNVRRLAVLNSWLWDASTDPTFRRLRRVLDSPLLPFLYTWLNVSPRFLLPRSMANAQTLHPDVHRHYIRPFSKRSDRSGPLAFARSLLNDQAWFGELGSGMSVLHDKPAIVIWGMKDPVLTNDSLDRWRDLLPAAEFVCLPDAGHFPQEETPQAVLQALLNFFDRT
jgi:haloalkane dehalogenase